MKITHFIDFVSITKDMRFKRERAPEEGKV
jgi:hypothetical protein